MSGGNFRFEPVLGSPAGKSPQRPQVWSAARLLEQVDVWLATVCSQKTLQRSQGPLVALSISFVQENLAEQALLFSKLFEGGALPSHRRH